MSDTIVTLTDADFQTQVLNSKTPTLVDFWAEWCAPCRALTPVVEQIATAYQGRLQVGKMNIDEHPVAPGQYAVRAIPTLLLFKDGKVADQIVGLVSRAKLEEMITKHVQ